MSLEIVKIEAPLTRKPYFYRSGGVQFGTFWQFFLKVTFGKHFFVFFMNSVTFWGSAWVPVWRQFSCFFLVRPYRVPRGCFGEAKVTILGTVWRPRAPIWESFCKILESFGIPSNKYEYLRKASDTLVHLAIHIQESL